MDKNTQEEIIRKSKIFFEDKIAANHLKNTNKLTKLSKFNYNPFVTTYLANYAFGEATPENIAKALIYPRVLGTSISTTFGTQMQNYCNEVFESMGSLTSGIDIEFIDALDNRKKYCQIKAGPNTINHDDIDTIFSHFRGVKNLARTNGVTINPSIDCIVGVLYGTSKELSGHYKEIEKEYNVLVGAEFWEHLTGNKNFYNELIAAFSEVASEYNAKDTLDNVITELAKDVKNKIK